jgi:nucleoid-associated protein YgaU
MSKTFKDMNDNLTIAEMADKSQWYDLISGNDLWKISKQFYGDFDKYNAIFEENTSMLGSVGLIYPGQKLRIPPLS